VQIVGARIVSDDKRERAQPQRRRPCRNAADQARTRAGTLAETRAAFDATGPPA
jgi:hypothetical protein